MILDFESDYETLLDRAGLPTLGLSRKRAYCSASEMFTVNRVPNSAAVIRNLTFKFMSRLGLSSNALVCSIIDSDLKFVSRIRLHWMNMLYIHFDGG